ncbi:MAG: baseplate protein [Epsilonproteobacteria bacterium]|nr:MAG: baseplate protein [Campylobacterota bacterium]
MVDKTFLGKGVSLSFNIDNSGAMKMSSTDKLIKESIFIILSTKIGERVMNYHFGCKIHELMFELNTAKTHARARAYVDEALKKWEPRVEVKRITVESLAKNELMIDIDYYIQETSVVDNLVYPFYLLESK